MDLQAQRYEDTVVLAPEGRINHASSEVFAAALRPHMERCAAGQDRLVLDMSRLEYISSAGLRVLMLARKQAQAQGGTLAVAALGPMLREIFEISRFSAVFDVYPSVRDALAAVSPSALAAFERA
jgi:anti-anti-sigma factor